MNAPSLQHSELKALKIEKGIISGKFKILQKDSTEYQQQLSLMKEISQRIKALESALKEELEHKNSCIQKTQAAPVFPPLDRENNWNRPFSLSAHLIQDVDDWNDFVKHNAYALPSHNPAWALAIEKSFGHKTQLICARNKEGQLLGGIPFTVFDSLLGKFAVSMPYLNYGGMVCEYFDISVALMNRLSELRTELALDYVEVRSIHPDLGEDPSTKKASMILRLPETNESLDKALGSKVRAQYKKADEHSPEYKIGKVELLKDFYSVFSHNMRDLGTPVYAVNWFRNLLVDVNLNASILIVYVKQKPVACAFLVNHGKLMEIPWASTIKSANKYNANMWMYRQVLSFAISQGCQYFDFGRSTIDAGTFKFKKQWGAEPCQNYWYTLLPAGVVKPELNPDNPKLKLFIFLWKLMPVWLTKIIGPSIIKNIP
jgi:serine/alanine adding enzyme